MKTIEVEIPEGKEAKWVDGVLTLVDEQPKDITERIKTFEDACEWCKENGKSIFTYEYNIITCKGEKIAPELSPDIFAYLKLRIITCALNEGWKPTFDGIERRWFNYFRMEDKDMCTDCECSTFNYQTAWMLHFKSEKIAAYAAAQFKGIYMDFCYKGKE